MPGAATRTPRSTSGRSGRSSSRLAPTAGPHARRRGRQRGIGKLHEPGVTQVGQPGFQGSDFRLQVPALGCAERHHPAGLRRFGGRQQRTARGRFQRFRPIARAAAVLSFRKRRDGSVADPTISIHLVRVTRQTIPVSSRSAPDGAVSFSPRLNNIRIDRVYENDERHGTSGLDWPSILC
jgi:hypothetical protein